jgi:hypothetical protein
MGELYNRRFSLFCWMLPRRGRFAHNFLGGLRLFQEQRVDPYFWNTSALRIMAFANATVIRSEVVNWARRLGGLKGMNYVHASAKD